MKLLKFAKALNGKHKYMVYIRDDAQDKVRKVLFGAKGYSNYTIHKDPLRKQRYITRHQKKEDWTRRGAFTPGFWSRWVLWNKPTLKNSLKVAKKKLGNYK
jgi:Family of unknown function (DUF5754)